MTSLRRRIVAVKWPKLAEIILLCNPFESRNCVEVHFLFWKNAIFFFFLNSLSCYFWCQTEKDCEEAKLEGKRQLSHTELKKKKKLTLAHLCFSVNLVQQNWFTFSKYNRLANAKHRRNTSLGKAFLGQAQLHWGKRGFFCHDNFFTAETSCFNQSNRKLYRMVCTPSGAFQCLGDSFKTGLKVNIFPCIPGVFTIAWKKSSWGGRIGGGKSLRILEGTQLFQKQTKKL